MVHRVEGSAIIVIIDGPPSTRLLIPLVGLLSARHQWRVGKRFKRPSPKRSSALLWVVHELTGVPVLPGRLCQSLGVGNLGTSIVGIHPGCGSFPVVRRATECELLKLSAGSKYHHGVRDTYV